MKRNIIVNKTRMIEILDNIYSIENLQELRSELSQLKNNLTSTRNDDYGVLNIDENGDTIKIEQNYLLNEIKQIEETQTLERTRYYLKRLTKGIAEIKTSKINDINLNRWKEYEEILTDSLWILPKRDSTGTHSAWYWGNFIPQIPHQMILRYTKEGECVLDPFAGNGTTLI
ncbi:MAG: DNA methyltransferase [Bacteroidota bacterium]|nr:DNA methyltransferase [Bacteroidota bacterium]